MSQQTIVAIDLETTGLDTQKDAIIEIGAVKFRGQRIEEEWHSLINPGRRISPLVTQLTNITDAMVRNSPTIQKVIDDLIDFVGDHPILGHNIRFDLAFLNRFYNFQYNDVIDTYEIASVLFPTAGRYKLSILAQELGIMLRANHRALPDARVTVAVYQKFFKEALELPIVLLEEITRLADSVADWDGFSFFYEVLNQRSKEAITAKKVRSQSNETLFRRAGTPHFENLQTNIEPSKLEPEEVASILEHGGLFSKYFPNYEYRHEQVVMLRAVTEAISEGKHLLVEAGTGVGKSLAYLIPAALFAMQNNTRVIVSTNTINLQDQLINKDIPDLRKALDIDLRAAILKGRNNYLCPRRLQLMRKRGPETPLEMRVLGKVLVWMNGGGSGDRNEININGPEENEIWSRLSAADEHCTTETCQKRMGGMCPFYLAKQSANSAHIIIVNHALLLSDIATGNRVLPEYDYLIIDEGHQLEAATTNALSFDVSQFSIIRILRDFGNKKKGIVGRYLFLLKDLLPAEDYETVQDIANNLLDLSFQMESLIRTFFASIESFLSGQGNHNQSNTYPYQVRIVPAIRTQPSWMDIEVSWEDSHATLKSLLDILEKMTNILDNTSKKENENTDAFDDLHSSITTIYRRLYEVDNNIDNLIFKPEADKIYWVRIHPNSKKVTLHAAPLHIGQLIEKYLWYEKQSVILTSATLTTAGNFDYIRGRTNAEEAYELSVGSPFDYETATLLYILKDVPEPNDRAHYQRAVEQALIKLCKALGGRTLALFTSYAQLRKTSHAINHALSDDGIYIYEQGEGASPHSLLESFKASERAVLLGTRAFWEGVDVPGETLSALVIVRLPFDVPSDPIVSARAESFEDPFYQYSLPEAILRFRQGFGRLIRTKSDRGIVVVLDKRIITKPYGQYFIDSLPTCTTIIGSLVNLPQEAQKWLNI